MATTDIPWPLAARECLIDIVAIDEIDTSGAIIVKMDTGDYDDPVVPEVEKGAVRIYYDGTLLFRKCPHDHPAFAKSKHPHGSDMVLICLEMFVDPKVKYVPQSMINFATRTALGGMWHGTLTVAEEVLTANDLYMPGQSKRRGTNCTTGLTSESMPCCLP